MEKTYVFTDLSARTAALSAGTLFTRGYSLVASAVLSK